MLCAAAAPGSRWDAADGGSAIAMRNGSATVDEVTAAIEHDIIFGLAPAGRRLVEDEIIARFDTTRHRTRRALDAVVDKGLAVRLPQRGVIVRDHTPREVEELYAMRDLLQSRAIDLLPLPLPDDTLDALIDFQQRHAAAGEAHDLRAIFHLNHLFHEAFFAACGDAVLTEAIADYAQRTHPIRSRGFTDPAYRSEAEADHAAIVEAARACDREALKVINSRHIARPRDLYLRDRALLARAAEPLHG